VSDEKEQESKAFEAKIKEKETIVLKLEQELKNANEPLQPSDIFELASVTADGFTILALGGSLFSAGERQSFSRPRQEAT
jgi:hypothetical protein